MKKINIISTIKEKVNELGWDYDRMSSSGQDTYDKLVKYLENLKL